MTLRAPRRVSPLARRLELAIGFALVAAACKPAGPTIVPPSTASPPPVVASTARPPASRPPGSTLGSELAERLRDGVSVEAVLIDLSHLQDIAAANGGARSAGSVGFDASATFVADELRRAGFDVVLQDVDVPFFRQDAPSTVEIAGTPTNFTDIADYKAMLFSGSGAVTADVTTLGFNANAVPGDRDGLGCDPNDWADVPPGMIVLVQPANCRRHDVVVNAQDAGAVALVTSYPEWETGGVLRPTLVEPSDIRIPVLGTTAAVGLALADAAATGADVHLETRTTVERRTSHNVLAETPGGDPAHVVMLGGHLDSVIDGPGINDNGTGTMATLEIARALARATEGTAPTWKVRVGFWTAEEIGLIGSTEYLGALPAADRMTIAAYLNFDMLGSPNGVRLVYDTASTTRPDEGGTIAGLFQQVFNDAGLPWQAALVGASDQAAFDGWSIPVGGLFSGANEVKTTAQADLFGGTAGELEDACYHRACDTADNVDRQLLDQMLRAAAWVTGMLASGQVAV